MKIEIIDALVKLVLGLLGIIIYAVWKVREHLSEFDWNKFLFDNKAFWLWSVTMLTLILLVITLAPETATAIKTMLGLDVSEEPAAFFTLGMALAVAANGSVKKKLDQKK